MTRAATPRLGRRARREFLKGAGSLTGLVLAPTGMAQAAQAAQAAAGGGGRKAKNIYAQLGVKTVINAAATYTALGGSLLPREVAQAMEQASRHFVSIPELQAVVGKRIAALVGSEAALVTSGAAGALLQGTAACIAGKDPEKIKRLPDTAGMKNEVIIQKAHHFPYEHAMRTAGARLVEIETADQLRAAIGKNTAMLFFLNNADGKGNIKRQEFVDIARKAGVPTLNDAAADVPPPGRLSEYVRMGFDLVAFSGGKGLQGPQCAGLLLGRKELIEAAYLNGSPHSDSVARAAKVGKEEIVGVLTALELYLKRDHKAEWRRWEQRVAAIAAAVAGVPSVKTEPYLPEIANESPHLRVLWDEKTIPLKNPDVVKKLRACDPPIEVRSSEHPDAPAIEMAVWMLQPGEERIVGRQLRRVLLEGAK